MRKENFHMEGKVYVKKTHTELRFKLQGSSGAMCSWYIWYICQWIKQASKLTQSYPNKLISIYSCAFNLFFHIEECVRTWLKCQVLCLGQGCGLIFVQLDISEYGAESNVIVQDIILPILVKKLSPGIYFCWC